MEKYIVWYAYSGMETEGHVRLEEPITLVANSVSEALYKYHCYNAFLKKQEPYHKNLTEHNKSKFPEGGWGFRVAKLDKDAYIDEIEHLKRKYENEGYSK